MIYGYAKKVINQGLELGLVVRQYEANKGNGKVFPYSLASIGPRADTGVHTVGLQVTLSHSPGSRLPLLSARPAVTFAAKERHCPSFGTKLYCLVTEVHMCEQLAQDCYAKADWLRFEPATVQIMSERSTVTSHRPHSREMWPMLASITVCHGYYLSLCSIPGHVRSTVQSCCPWCVAGIPRDQFSLQHPRHVLARILARMPVTSRACLARGLWTLENDTDTRAALHGSRPPADQSGIRVANWTGKSPDTHDTNDMLRTSSRGYHEAATRKMVPWN